METKQPLPRSVKAVILVDPPLQRSWNGTCWGILGGTEIVKQYDQAYGNELARNEVAALKTLAKHGALRHVPRCISKDVEKVKDSEQPRIHMELEWTGRMPLSTYITRNFKTYTMGDVRLWMRCLFEILETAHEAGLVHGNLSPESLWINNKDKRMQVVDWSLAMESNSKPTKSQARLVRLGTLSIRSPEQLFDGPGSVIDPAMDIWAAGCILGYLIQGQGRFFDWMTVMDRESEIKSAHAAQLVAIFEQVGLPNREDWPSYPRLMHEFKSQDPTGASHLDRVLKVMAKDRLDDTWTPSRDKMSQLKRTCFVKIRSSRHFRARLNMIDLLRRLLALNPSLRLTAKSAQQHPFLAPLQVRLHKQSAP